MNTGEQLNELALFAGDGGGILGGKLLGWRTVCAVEIKPSSRRTLCARQKDGCLEAFPIWDDVTTFDGLPWSGVVDIATGGFPCQDISVAGGGTGLDGKKSGLWSHMRRIIGEVRPRRLFIENSPALTTRGGVRVIGDLAALGYDCRWGIVSAADAIWSYGTPCLDHLRERIWIAGTRADTERTRLEGITGQGLHGAGRQAVQSSSLHRPRSNADCLRELQPQGCEQDQRGRLGYGGEAHPHANGTGCEEQRSTVADGPEHEAIECGGWWSSEPGMGRMAHGLANRVDRLHGLGNGQVPAVVEFAWEILNS